MKRLVYMAYPIDNALLTENQIAWINGGKARLLGNEANPAVAVFDPGDAFRLRHGAAPGPEITIINEKALETADAVLAYLPQGISSIGVPMEIAMAGLMGKPVAVLSDSYSWALRSDRSNVRIFAEGDSDGAIEWLLNVEIMDADMLREQEPMPVATVRGFPDKGQLPTRAHADDAGLDLYVSVDTWLPWGQFVDVPCGVKVQLPDWSWGLLVGRSSTFRRRKIEVQTGIIDSGYRGELFAACIWRPEDDVYSKGDRTLVKAGERLAQIIILPNGTRDVQPVPADELDVHDRGENGFGSSGA